MNLPTTRDENWKYTDLSLLAAKPRDCVSHKIISFKNNTQAGINITEQKKPENSATNSAHSDLDSDVFESLNKKFNTEYYEITITENISQPLEIIYSHTTENQWAQPRIKINIAENIKANIIEIFASPNPNIINAVIEFNLKSGAKLEYYKIQAENLNSFHIGRTHILLEAKSQVQTFTLSKGSRLARSDIFVTFQGEHARCDLYGLSYSKDRQHLDHHTVINHAVGNCQSNEFYKSILDEKSRVVFNGKVIVKPNASHTETSQINNNILLSSEAEIDTKPELEIYHDDIKCTHGATIGQLDDHALFYLRSRGLSEADAKNVLIQAFGNPVLDKISDGKLRERLCQY